MVIVTLVISFTIMAGDWAPPEIVFTIVNSLFHTAGIVTDAQAATGYGNTGLLTVIFLYMVAEGIYQTGALEGVMLYLLGKSRSPFWGIVRLMFPCMFISAFLNNTPVVALLTPIVISWCRRTGVPAKKMLIPLSYAATIGGTCTLIGTSTNLVISGQQSSRYKNQQPLGIFAVAPQGVPYALWGFIFVALTHHWLLPGNSSKFAKDLYMALRVNSSSSVKEKTLVSSGLLSMHAVSVVGHARNGQWKRSVDPKMVLQDGDTFYVVGEIADIEYYSEEYGLTWLNHESEDSESVAEAGKAMRSDSVKSHYVISKDLASSNAHSHNYARLVQVTVKSSSDLINTSIATADLSNRFSTVALGFKSAEMLPPSSILRENVIQAGDILVMNAEELFDPKSADVEANFSHICFIKEGSAKEFISSFVVTPGSELAQKTLTQVGLRGIPGLHAFALDCAGGQRLDSIPSDIQLQEGDTIWFSLDVPAFIYLRKLPGIQQSEFHQVKAANIDIIYRELTQAVVSPKSYLVGKTLKEAKFREKYNAAAVALCRESLVANERLSIAEVVIQAGDMLLLEAHLNFSKDHHVDKTFSVLLPVSGSSPPKKSKGLIAVTLGAMMVATQIVNGLLADNKSYTAYMQKYLYRSDLINLWPAAVLTTFLMLLAKCLTFKQATDSILWDVYLTVAAAFGVSVAVEATGVAKGVADIFVNISKNIGGQGPALTAIYLATALLSEILTNNAAGAVMFPIAATVADQLNIDPNTMSVAIMLGASAGFINPFSYQCNLMVFTAGNYTFGEFASIGAPFQVFLAITAGFILCYFDQWQQVWIVTWVVVAFILAVGAIWTNLPRRLTLRAEDAYTKHVSDPVAAGFRKFIFVPTRRGVKRLKSSTRLLSLRSPSRAAAAEKDADKETVEVSQG